MTRANRVSILLAAILISAAANAADAPGWAYPVSAPDEPSPRDDGRALHVPDSSATFTRTRLEAIEGPVSDWHADEHPEMPAIVGRGRPPRVYACAYCHLPNGAGRPENASLAGLSASYIRQQIADFRSGKRPGSEPKRGPQTAMIAIAQAATDEEVGDAAAYFASLKPSSFVHVVETETVPKTVVAGWALAPNPGGGEEPIAGRIIEMPVDRSRFENRDSRAPYVAYVPVGSISRGEHLAATGVQGLSIRCAICHGPELKGLLDVPRLAGRSPSYLARQLFDLRDGKRTGPSAALMQLVAAKMTDDDIVAAAAYLGSRAP